MDLKTFASKVKTMAEQRTPAGYVDMKENLRRIVVECSQVIATGVGTPSFGRPVADENEDVDSCAWCGENTSSHLVTGNNDVFLCNGCLSDLPDWIKNRNDIADDFASALCDDDVDDAFEIPFTMMQGSLKQFTTGIYAYLALNEDEAFVFKHYRSMDGFKADITDPEDGWKVQYAVKDGKPLNFSVQVTEG